MLPFDAMTALPNGLSAPAPSPGIHRLCLRPKVQSRALLINGVVGETPYWDGRSGQSFCGMNWKSIRLELGSTGEYPEGSVSRAYLLRLPLDASDVVDSATLARSAAKATVRRHWSTEADQRGVVVSSGSDWAMRCDGGVDRVLASRRDADAARTAGVGRRTRRDRTSRSRSLVCAEWVAHNGKPLIQWLPGCMSDL